MYDAIILGGGPAGLAAAVYLARQKIKFLMLAGEVGGYVLLSEGVENYLGFHLLNGLELVKKFKDHLKDYEGSYELHEGEMATSVGLITGGFKVVTPRGEYETRAVLVATGTKHRSLGIPGEKELTGRGITYCATCDAPLFKDKRVFVIGGGNSAMNAALFLEKYTDKIVIVTVNTELKGDVVKRSKILASGNIRVYANTRTTKIIGEARVTGIGLVGADGAEREEPADGVLVEIGLEPRSEAVDIVEKDKKNQIIVDKHNCTSREGIFAAGDVTDITEKQISVAVGEGSKAALTLIDWLEQDAVTAK